MALQRQAGNRAVSRLVARRTAGTAKPASSKSAASRSVGSGSAGPKPTGAKAGASVATGSPSAAQPTGVVNSPPGAERAAAPPAEAVVQRLTDGKPGARQGPAADPKFTALTRNVRSKQQTLANHPPPKSEAAAAQGAAKSPPDDKEAQGKAANAEKMNAAKPGEFDKAAFVKAVNEAIAKQAPKNLDEADKFGDSGKAAAVRGEVQGKVGAGKQASVKAIETTTKAAPDTSAAKEKTVTPLKPDQPPPKPGTPHPGQAVPDKAPPAATDFSAGPKQVDQQMADAQVTEEQLAKSNEPEFTGALQEKKAGEAHAATAPGQVRATEATTLAGAKAEAAQAGAAAMATMTADRAKAGKDVGAGKEGAKSEDEKKREQVTATLQKVFDATKKDVEDILGGLDKKVDDKFDSGEKAARDAFTAEYTRKIDDYKDKRYSGLVGKGRWVKDKFAGLPSEVNVFYEQARDGYVKRMQGVISGVADVIGAELSRAKQRIAKGRADLQAEVRKLPAELQTIGEEAAADFSGKFDELTQQVNDKGTQLVDTLASKYTEALKTVDAEIAAEKEKNKGLIAKAIDAVKGVIDTILKLKDLLLGVLAKAAQSVGAIIKDPIGFLGKLVSAVGAGLGAFIANIANHLKKGLVSWLLGAAAKAGLQLPERFDLKGILGLIASLLGLTWAAIRGRVVSKGVPEQAMGAVESSVPMAQKIQSEGIGGVWEQLKGKVGDLKATLLGKIAQYLIPTVIVAGITWIISLLNPASAFVKACKAIIDIVTFVIDRGAQIIAFVNAVLDAVIAIAGGGAGGVPGLIETALATAIPVLIGFLAALLGIGGLAEKVKKLFQSLSKPVMKAVDWIVGKIAAFGKKLWAKIKSKIPGRKGGDGRSDRRKQQDLDAGLNAAHALVARHLPRQEIEARLPAIKAKYRLQSLRLVVVGRRGNEHKVHVEGRVNPGGRRDDAFVPGEVYESIDPAEKGSGSFRFTGDQHISKQGADVIELTTNIKYFENNNVKAEGKVRNAFNLQSFELIMKEHFLDAIPSDKRWIEAPEKPVVPGRGTRLITYVNLRQIKKFERHAGDAAVKEVKAELRAQGLRPTLDPDQEARIRKGKSLYSTLKHVTLNRVQNLKALLQLHQQVGLRRGADINEAILRTASIPYVEVILRQAGGRIKSAEVVNVDEVTIGELMSFYEESASSRRRAEVRAYHQELLTEFGVARATKVLYDFDVKLTIEPFAQGSP